MFIYLLIPLKLGVIGNYINDSKDDSKNKQKYGFWMFDKLKYPLEEVVPYTEKRMDIYSKTIDREGNILFVARVFEDESEREIKDGKPNFHFEILKYTKDSKGAIVIPFKFEENYVSQLRLFEDFQGRIVCTGFYASKNRKGKVEADGSAVDGTFFLKINPEDNKISNINKGFYEIPTEVLMQYEKGKDQKRIEKEEAKGGVAAAHLELRSVKFDEDGGITLFGEQYYETTIYSGKITYTLFHFNDIIVQHIGNSDADSWTKKIPKNQVQGNWKGLGFNVLKTPTGYSVFFMDNLKNLNLTTTQAPEPHSTGIDGILMCVSLSNKGEMKKTKVFDTREMKDNINIIKADQVGNNAFIDRTWVKKKSKICLMTIE